jgi:hypothetical protein
LKIRLLRDLNPELGCNSLGDGVRIVAGSPLFDERWQADGVGALSAPAIAFALIAPMVLAMMGRP